MSEETTPTTEPVTEEQPQTFTQEQVNAFLAEQKRKTSERYSDYDALRQKAAKLDEIEEQSKSEQQRIAEAAERARREADEAKAEALRYKAAATHRIEPDYFDLLGSGDEETIAGRAERVGELLNARREVEQLRAELDALRSGKPAPASGRPVQALRPGATPTHHQSEEDVLYSQLFGGS